MKGDKLHNFLISLNQAEKNQCTRYLLPSGKKAGKYAVLYKILTEQNDYDEKLTLQELYNTPNPSQRRFEATCDYLSELVIQALALKDEEIGSKLPIIRKAREKGLIRLAGKNLAKAIQEATKTEEFEELLILYQEKELLSSQFSLELKLGKEHLSRKDVFQSLVNLESLNYLLKDFRSFKWIASEGNAEGHLVRLESGIKRIEPRSARERFLYNKLQMRVAFIRRKYFEASKFQEKVMDLVYNSQIPRIVANRIEESGHMLRVYHNNGLFDAADLELMRLKASPIKTAHDQILFYRHSLVAAFISAFTLGKIPSGLSALDEFLEVAPQIPDKHRVKLHYYAALFQALNGNWRGSRPHLNAIQKMPSKIKKIFSWQPELLLALGYLEEDEPDMASLLLDRVQRKSNNETYPLLISRCLVRILYTSARESRLLLTNLRSRLIELREQPGSRIDSIYFDMVLWIDARLQGKTLIEISKSQHFLSARQTFARIDITGRR